MQLGNDLIFKTLEVVIIVIATIIARYVIPWIKQKVNIAKIESIYQWTDKFVHAAEQLIQGEKMGEEKLKAVSMWLKEKSDEIGLEMTDEEIRVLIESFVYTLKQEKK